MAKRSFTDAVAEKITALPRELSAIFAVAPSPIPMQAELEQHDVPFLYLPQVVFHSKGAASSIS